MSRLQPPTAGELDCLTVLWRGREEGIEAMRLGQIRDRIITRRLSRDEPAPAVTTVSTYLRSALHKGLLEEVRLDNDGGIRGQPSPGARGVMRGVRSPHTGYRAIVRPHDVFIGTLSSIADAYPDEERLFLLVHVAEALSVPTTIVGRIRDWVERQNS